MKTFVQYKHAPDRFSLETRLTALGGSHDSPEEVLQMFFHSYFVVDYLGIEIPSRSLFLGGNEGLRISVSNDGYGADSRATFNRFTTKSIHAQFSRAHYEIIFQKMQRELAQKKFISNDEAEKYAAVFRVLEFPQELDDILSWTASETKEPVIFQFPFKAESASDPRR
ncbi:MAG: hypothetical protein RL557_799 [archaeon]|jgi:hypothetical protein